MSDTTDVSVCLLELPNGKFVFERRTKDAPISAHKLSLFGGHLQGSETALHGVRREMSEETSLDVKHLHVKHMGSYPSARIKNANMSLYIAKISKPDFKVFEGEDREVYGIDEVLARSDVDPDARQLITKYQETYGSKHY